MQVAKTCSAAGAAAVEVATVDVLDDNAVDTLCAQLLKARRDAADRLQRCPWMSQDFQCLLRCNHIPCVATTQWAR